MRTETRHRDAVLLPILTSLYRRLPLDGFAKNTNDYYARSHNGTKAIIAHVNAVTVECYIHCVSEKNVPHYFGLYLSHFLVDLEK